MSIHPAIRYRDPHAAIDFLTTALGFTALQVHEDDDGAVAHAELAIADGVIMIGTIGKGDKREDRTAGNASVYIALDDVEARYERATTHGAQVERELQDTPYGSREFTVSDPEGNRWSVGNYRPEIK
jgi:uncharacterized glyoxalase superfamily protein PhnB